MPLYEYECAAENGRRFEVIQKFSDEPVKVCPTCGGAVRRLISSPAIQFKGSGWYITDYAKKSGTDSGKSGTDAGKDSKADSSSSNRESGDSSSSKGDSGDSSSSKGDSRDSSSSKGDSRDSSSPASSTTRGKTD